MEQPQFMVLDGKDLETLDLQEVARLLAPELAKLGYLIKKPTDEASTGPVIDIPVKETPKPVAGYPRVHVGTRLDKGVPHAICLGTGIPGLLEVVSQPGEPDAYVDRGFNLDYNLLPGIERRPTGTETFWGLDPVPGAVRQPGYRQRYFEKDGRAYWEFSDLPDEAPPVRSLPEAVTTDPSLTHLAHYGTAPLEK